MKKSIFVLAIMIAMFFVVQTVNAQNTANVSINMSMTVDKYIETAPGPLAMNFGLTTHNGTVEEVHTALAGSPTADWNIAYANCPFTLTVTGNNPAGQLKPRFAKLQDGPTGGAQFDILSTTWQIAILTNGLTNNELGWNYGVRAGQFPQTATISETPHNGQVRVKMNVKVNSKSEPSESEYVRETLIDPLFTNAQSADAGVYSCTMLVTLTAI